MAIFLADACHLKTKVHWNSRAKPKL